MPASFWRYAFAIPAMTPEAEDMLMESFIKIFASIHQFRWEGSFEGWIRKVPLYTCLKKIKKSKSGMTIPQLRKIGDSIPPQASPYSQKRN
jgi:DNA-directed RNA polymerase specialized sigma24 family protein